MKLEEEEKKLIEDEEQRKKEYEEAKAKPAMDKHLDTAMDFFAKPSFLTVSGQLSIECFACALSDCYSFGPTFRAEDSHTTRHLAEFWMVEPELVFAGMDECIQSAEAYLKYCFEYILVNNRADLEFFDEHIEKGIIERLQAVVDTPFKILDYSEAVEIIAKEVAEKKIKFDQKKKVPKIEWGIDFSTEMERHLCDEIFHGPVVVVNFPKAIKSFYMKQTEEEKTVLAMDILMPKVGEIVGGSVREDRLDVLDARMDEKGLDKEIYWYYRQLREYGTVPHCGYGVGFERLIMMATGIENIREAIPFPRWGGNAEF